MILLDTNVISEALKPTPAPNVVRWLNANHANAAISSITIFELEAGVGMLDAGRRKDALENAMTRMVRRFGSRVYAFDAAAAQAAARLLVRAKSQGLGLHQVPNKLADLQIAGVARAYGLELATRNTGDFAGLDITLIDPWGA
jgi:toxin FitB